MNCIDRHGALIYMQALRGGKAPTASKTRHEIISTISEKRTVTVRFVMQRLSRGASSPHATAAQHPLRCAFPILGAVTRRLCSGAFGILASLARLLIHGPSSILAFVLWRRPGVAAFFLAGIPIGVVPPSAFAQPVEFGASDDPREELQVVWWRYQSSLDLNGGLSLISDHWRGGVAAGMNVVTRPVTARLSGALRGGIYGAYDPDTDETYDLIRTIEFVRPNPSPRARWYARVGQIRRMRLGTGHVVNFFNSHVAWDERTVGAEAAHSTPLIDLEAFTDNVLVNGVTAARAALRPLFWSADLRTRSLELGLNYVTDLRTRTADSQGLTAFNTDMSFNAIESGEIRFVPFASFAWYPEYGSGISFGARIESDNFIDLARFRLRMALYYNGRQFIPGYVGSFYQVNNPQARILNSEKYLTGEQVVNFEGIALKDALGGNDFETELRLLVFERFELWYYFRRHYGTHSLSEYHLRMFFHQPNRVRVNVGMDRGGLLGFFSLFNDLGDQTALVFGTDYRIAGPFWALVHARYTFEQAGSADDGTRMFLVQRRFEPFTGIRLNF